jgi:hypothetical protein
VAQTRRKRQTKHRGNATGAVVSRGRTGRKPTSAEKGDGKSGAADERQQRRLDRLNRPPTWRNAFLRAFIAAVLVLVVGLTLLRQKVSVVLPLFPLVLLVYVPVSYYTDLWMYRRRQRRQGEAPTREKAPR